MITQYPLAPIELSSKYSVTRFGELETSLRTSQLNYKPTWGISTTRYMTTNTGAGATAGETSGEFRLQSGTANNGESKIVTNRRGQYQSGTMGQAGIGIRIPTLPLSTAYCEWGYTDFTNGFYFGVDGTGKYVAIVTGSSVTKVYQTNWNLDKMDGTGTSGLTLLFSEGVICQIDFVWYGYGDVEFSFFTTNHTTFQLTKTVAHRLRVVGSTSIVDPNQPLAFRSGNGASTTTDVSLYVGGHQFSVKDGNSTPQQRPVAELLTNYTTAANTNWQALISVRKKSTFASRPNSVNVAVDHFHVYADGEVEVRVTIGGITSNLTFAVPTGWTATETACETKTSNAGAMTTSSDGTPYDYSYSSATTGRGVGEANIDETVRLGDTQEVILWVRRLSAAGVIVVKHASVAWIEEW